MGENNLCDVLSGFELFLWKISLNNSVKAPGNYSDRVRSNKISVLCCEGPKPSISMISGFLNPGAPYL